jgi:hypothetical protein
MLYLFEHEKLLNTIESLYWYDCKYCNECNPDYVPHRKMLADESVEYLYDKLLEETTYQKITLEDVAFVEQYIEFKTFEKEMPYVDWLMLFDTLYEKIHDLYFFYTEENKYINLPIRKVW